jgi:hypothetical protein
MLRYIILLFLFLYTFSYSKVLETCYKGYYFFLPLVENCITYEDNKISATAHSTTIGSLFKKVEYSGYSVYKEDLKPAFFYFIQIESDKKIIHSYTFSKDYIIFNKKVFKLEDDKYFFQKEINEKIKNEGYVDPFLASLYLYKQIKENKNGYLNIFYDGKGYKVPFKILDKEKVQVYGKEYQTIKVYIQPDFKTSGLLKPVGNWYVWIDEKLNVPVKMRLTFSIGTFFLYIESIKNNP